MRNLYKPLSILLSVTLPQVWMIGLFGRIFWILHTELTEKQTVYWIVFGSTLALACLGFTVYSILRWRHKEELPVQIVYLIFAFYFCFLTVYLFLYTEIIPSTIPEYMFMGVSPSITVLTLTMPALAYGMLMITERIVERFQIKSILKPFLFMIGIPIFWYLLIHLIIKIENHISVNVFQNIMPIIFIVSSAAFIFLFVSIIYVLLKRKSNLWYQYIGIIVFLGSFMGLALNQSLDNLFGDFSHVGFYLCNIAVTGIIMIPQVANQRLRLLVFSIKGCLLIYSLYFFIVFLPYVPLSLVGIVVFGLGILLLMPILLLFLHVHSLRIDYKYLQQFYKKKNIIGLILLQLLVIPVIFGIFVQQDQANLDRALRYTYQRSYQEETSPKINTRGIKRALSTIKHMNGNNQRGNNFFTVTSSTPYLTSLYHYYVLDNLSISPNKVKRLENIFFGEYEEGEVPVSIDPQIDIDVQINKIKSETVYEADQQVYKSWIHFELENTADNLSEFYTTFKIPEGCIISNYYLYVEDEKKYGMIADKRAANWIYEQNKIRNRDPGVLTYLPGNEIEFKIFPFLEKEIRKTGIELLHPTSMDLTISGELVSLQTSDPMPKSKQATYFNIHPQIQYVTKEMKTNLTKMTRNPKYYFILDYSKGNEKNTEFYIQSVKDFIANQGIHADVSEIIGVNFEENRVVYQEDWEKNLQDISIKGGFYPDYTIKRILYEHYSNHLEEQPIFLLVTNAIEKAILTENFADFRFMNPEGLQYYHLTEELGLMQYALQVPFSYEGGRTVSKMTEIPVIVWRGENGRDFYLPDDGQDSIILKENKYEVAENEISVSGWENGILLQAMYRDYLLYPEQHFEKSLSIVKRSIMSDIMSPLTSFIVLENKAQEKVMLEKQKQILATQKPLDIGDLTEMQEPSILIIAFLIMGFLVVKKQRYIVSK